MSTSFKKTNIIQISKIKSLINNLSSFSKDQLNQTKGADLTPKNKSALKSMWNDDKYHLVVGINILMYMQRQKMVDVRDGKVQWVSDTIQEFVSGIDYVIQCQLDKEERIQSQQYHYSNQVVFNLQLIVQFCMQINATQYLVDHPKYIGYYSNDIEKLMGMQFQN